MRNLLSLILLLFSAFTTLFAEKTIIKLEQYTTEDGLAHRTVSGMLQDKTGLIWFATWNGLCSFDGNKFKTYKPEDDNANSRVDKIWELDNGVFVCRMYNERVLLFNPKTEEFSLYNNDDLLPPKINSLYKVDYDNERLSFRNTETDSVYYYKIGNSGIHLGVHYSFTDKQGNVWLNFNDRILKFSFTPERYEYHTQIDDITKEPYKKEVRAIFSDHDSRLWVAAKNKRVFIYDKSGEYLGNLNMSGAITKEYAEMEDNVYSIFQASDKSIWIATKGAGVMRLLPTGNPAKFNLRQYKNETNDINSLGSNNVYSFLEDSMNRIWIGTYGAGVTIATTSSDGNVRFRNVDRRSILQERKYGIRIRHLCKLNDEYIAASTTMGVIIYDMNGECVQKVGTYNTMSTTVTNDSVILVSTLGNGLNRIIRENNEWKMVKCDIEGTPDVVNSVTEDSEGNLWMLSDNVLIQYSHEDKNLVKYSTEFFNINPSFSEAAPMLTKEGDLLIGESNGYIKISCHSIEKSNFVPSILLTDIVVDGEAVPNPYIIDSLAAITLKAGQRNLKLEFSTLDFTAPSGIYYAYKIEGKDTDWTYLKNNRTVSLDNLEAGKYVLKVRSTNSDKLWIDNERSFNIIVPNTFTYIIKYVLIFLLLISLSLTVYFYSRVKALIKTKIDNDVVKAEIELEPEQPEIVYQNEIFLKKVMEFMESNMDNSTLGVEDFANHLGCSRSRFYRQMKLTLDLKPVDFIRDMRMKRAIYLLESKQYNISEVAFMTGFSDSKYFSKVFKKEKGVTPSEYINQL